VGGIGKEQLVEIVEQTPKMIGMAMGEKHMADIVGRNACRIEGRPKLARTRHEARAGARVEKHRIGAVLVEREVAGRLEHVAGDAVLGKDRPGLFGIEIAEHELAGQRQVPVAERDDSRRAERHFRRGAPGTGPAEQRPRPHRPPASSLVLHPRVIIFLLPV